MSNDRRQFLQGLGSTLSCFAGFGATVLPQSTAIEASHSTGKPRVRDKLWVWSLVAGMYNDATWSPGKSRITPAEAAFYLGVPNVCMVTYKTDCVLKPAPPYDQYGIALLPLRQVVWPIGGAQRSDITLWLKDILQLSQTCPNIVGIQLDDFYTDTLGEGEIGSLSSSELAYVRKELRTHDRRLGL